MARRPQHWLDLRPGVTWHGQVDEFARLLGCVGKHCTCQTSHECGPHQLLAEQATLDRLVYVRSARGHFVDAEWNTGGLPATRPTPTSKSVGRRHPTLAKSALLTLAFAVLVGLMGVGGAWHAPAVATPPIGAWQTR